MSSCDVFRILNWTSNMRIHFLLPTHKHTHTHTTIASVIFLACIYFCCYCCFVSSIWLPFWNFFPIHFSFSLTFCVLLWSLFVQNSRVYTFLFSVLFSMMTVLFLFFFFWYTHCNLDGVVFLFHQKIWCELLFFFVYCSFLLFLIYFFLFEGHTQNTLFRLSWMFVDCS